MATAISQANFETALGNAYDYIIAKDWDNAWLYYAAAEAQLSGLEEQAGSAGSYFRLKSKLDGLGEAIEKAEAKVSRAADTHRFIRMKTGRRGK
jgi:hypothetical protein